MNSLGRRSLTARRAEEGRPKNGTWEVGSGRVWESREGVLGGHIEDEAREALEAPGSQLSDLFE